MDGGNPDARTSGRWREREYNSERPPRRDPGEGPAGGSGGEAMGGDGSYNQGLPSGAAFDAATGAAAGSGGTTILKLRGLPFSISDDDICQWFNEDNGLGISPVIKDK